MRSMLYLQNDKVHGPEGNTLSYELAKRSPDAAVNERVKEYISQGTSNLGYHHVRLVLTHMAMSHHKSDLFLVLKCPRVVAPTPGPVGFMPMKNSGAVQRPEMGSVKPSCPNQNSPVQPAAAPVAARPTILTFDTSSVPGASLRQGAPDDCITMQRTTM